MRILMIVAVTASLMACANTQKEAERKDNKARDEYQEKYIDCLREAGDAQRCEVQRLLMEAGQHKSNSAPTAQGGR